MQLIHKSNEKLTITYDFIMSKASFDAAMDSAAKLMTETVRVDGFRKGHAPLDVVKKRHAKDLIEKVVIGGVNNAIDSEVKAKNYNLATSPKINNISEVDFFSQDGFTLTIVLELRPEVEKIDLSSFTIESPKLKLEDGAIEKELLEVQKSFSKAKKIEEDRDSVAGDIINIDFTGYIGAPDFAEKFAGGEGNNYLLELGSGSFIPGFEDQLIGKRINDEVDVKVTFPKEYHKEDLSGAEALFKVKINSLHVKELPALDENLAKMVGMESIDDLKNAIKKRAEESYDVAVFDINKKKILDMILEKYPFDLPPSILNAEIERQKEAQKKHLEECKDDGHNHAHQTEDEIIKSCENSLRTIYLLQHFIQSQSISVAKEEFEAVIERQALYRGLGDYRMLLDLYEKNAKAKRGVYAMIEENKAVEYILSQVKKVEPSLTKEQFDEYLKQQRTAI